MATTKSYSNKKGTRSVHYTDGKKTLTSHHSSNGRVKHYDANGRYLGSTRKGGYGHVDHYDNHGNRVGTSYIKPSGSVHYSAVPKNSFLDNDRSDSFESEHQITSSYRSIGKAPLSHANNEVQSKHTSTSPNNKSDENIQDILLIISILWCAYWFFKIIYILIS